MIKFKEVREFDIDGNPLEYKRARVGDHSNNLDIP